MKNYKNSLKALYPDMQTKANDPVAFQEMAASLKETIAKASAYGLPALAALVPMGELEAAVVPNVGFGGPINVPNNNAVFIDIDNDGNDDFRLAAGTSFFHDLGIGNLAGAYLTASFPIPLASGVCISAASANAGGFGGVFNLYDGLSSVGNWPNGTSGFIGVRFNSTIAGGSVFGWVGVTAGAGTMTITGWGYEDVPGTPIGAGDMMANSCGAPPALPTISQVDADGDGNPDIFDPCSCADPQNIVDGNGMVTHFHDFVLINNNTGTPGETWEITALNSGAIFQNDGVTPIAIGTALTDLGGGVYRIDLWHPAGVGFNVDVSRTAGGPAVTLSTGGTCAACPQIPTLGQWGLITLGLFLLSFGTVMMGRYEGIFAMGDSAGRKGRYGWDVRSFPFYLAEFKQALLGSGILAAALGVFSLAVYGEITAVDFFGTMVTAPIFAYLTHLVMIYQKEAKKRMRNAGQ